MDGCRFKHIILMRSGIRCELALLNYDKTYQVDPSAFPPAGMRTAHDDGAEYSVSVASYVY